MELERLASWPTLAREGRKELRDRGEGELNVELDKLRTNMSNVPTNISWRMRGGWSLGSLIGVRGMVPASKCRSNEL